MPESYYIQRKVYKITPLRVFAGAWILLFILYLPAAEAGRVTDFTGWAADTVRSTLWENINRTHYKAQAMFQFTQFVTWACYQIFGVNAWAWHILHITLHAINATLLYLLGRRLLTDAGVGNNTLPPLFGVLLFCIAPHVSEVIVWEPAYHFAQALIFILLILLLAIGYIHTRLPRYAIGAGIVYLLSSFTLEIFYVTPLLVLALCAYYYSAKFIQQPFFRKAAVSLLLPMAAILLLHFMLVHAVYGNWIPHVGYNAVEKINEQGLGKPAKSLFHLLVFGRFFPENARNKLYLFCDSNTGIIIFYGVIAIVAGYILLRFRTFTGKGKVAAIVFTFTCIALSILPALWFERLFLVAADRYLYFTAAFTYLLGGILISYLPQQWMRVSLLSAYALVNLRYNIQVNRYWMKSRRIIGSLVNTFPATTTKTVLLLNLPQNMHGIPMITSGNPSEFEMLYNTLHPQHKLAMPVYDVLAFNMVTPADGVHVTVINDTTLRVILNQGGGWWWYSYMGAASYANSQYAVEVTDGGWYELRLKRPSENYLLLFTVGSEWRTADMNRTGDQF